MSTTRMAIVAMLAMAPMAPAARAEQEPSHKARGAGEQKKPGKGKKADGAEKGAGSVVTTPSGLKYVDETVGTGAAPAKGKKVTVHYTGTMASNGQKFDSSVDRGKPFSFTIGVGQVIPGWDEGVMTMKVGGKRKLMIPSKLGYGARGFSPVIPPNSDLNFDVELLAVD